MLLLSGSCLGVRAVDQKQFAGPFNMNTARLTPRWKRVLDIFFLFAAMPAVLFLTLIIAALIKLVSRGPVLLRQERIGFLGQRFMCFKFRTMHVGADTTVHERHLKELLKSDKPMVKMDAAGDPRLIRFGALLRASGLDELPQLINVWRGEMSLVGPRPCLLYEFEQYEPWHRERFDTLPGLTGLWQVRGKNKTTFTEMIHLDIHYARTKSFGLDLRIMAETFSTLAAQVMDVRVRPKSKLNEDAAYRHRQPHRLMPKEPLTST